jgi:hypothetical protein
MVMLGPSAAFGLGLLVLAVLCGYAEEHDSFFEEEVRWGDDA